MPAPIVYEGVGGGNSGGGRLFNGLKFWIALRVPQRSHWVELVEANGGEVVVLEKLADILIADHARKNAPPGSYSWRFIEDAIKKGHIDDREDYLINPAVEIRPAGSSAPGKITRNPFTAADDQILMKWVIRNERHGKSLAGNTIYQELAKKYPNHTWQSWRDRWVRKLSMQERPRNLSPDAEPATPSRRQDRTPAPAPASASVQAVTPTPARRHPGGGGRLRFTEDDDKILLAYVNEAEQNGKPIRGNVIYQELADLYPHHTWQSWRDRYVRHLSRSIDQADGDDGPEASTQTPSKGPPHTRQVSKSIHVAPEQDMASGANIDQKETVKDHSPLNNENPPDEDAAATSIQRIWRGYLLRRDLTDFKTRLVNLQACIRGFIPRKIFWVENTQPTMSQQPAPVRQRAKLTDREQFHRDLQEYLDVTGASVPLWPKIGGRNIALWDLFRAVTEQDTDIRDWQRVAEDMNIDWIAFPNAPSDLENCFENNLGDFERALMQFDEEDEEDEEQEEEEVEDSQIDLISHGDTMQTSRSAASSGPQLPSSPPVMTGRKRSLPPSLLSDPAYPTESSRKRRRVDRSSEIPSTPDDKIGLAGARMFFGSGTGARVRGTDNSPSSQQLPSLPERRNKKFSEPETQDFGYDPETQAYFTVEDLEAADVTPSQQLQSESPDVTPIQFSLSKSRAAKHQQDTGESSAEGPKIKQEQFGSPRNTPRLPASLPPQQSPTARPARRSLPQTYKPETNTSMNRSNGNGSSETPRNGKLTAPSKNSREMDGGSAASRGVQPAQQTQADLLSGSVQEVVEHFMSLGYPQKLILNALKATTLKPGYPMTFVLERLQKGDGIPDYHEGVWTARDDESLRFIISYEKVVAAGEPQHSRAASDDRKMRKKAEREMKRLTVKHGEEGVEERRKFLAMMAGED